MTDRVDPAMRDAFNNLPDATRQALLLGDPDAGQFLRDAYLAEKRSYRPVPNRAARRAALKNRRKART
jgi:hypothetical protein